MNKSVAKLNTKRKIKCTAYRYMDLNPSGSNGLLVRWSGKDFYQLELEIDFLLKRTQHYATNNLKLHTQKQLQKVAFTTSMVRGDITTAEMKHENWFEEAKETKHQKNASSLFFLAKTSRTKY